MNNLMQDIRYGIRTLAKRPGFAFVALLTLTLGIGANTAIFTVVNAALIRGLPYKDPERLYHLWEKTPRTDFPRREASYPDYLDWQQNESFEGLAAYNRGGAVLRRNETVEMISTGSASSKFFTLLGAEPIYGRTFLAGEDQPGAERVAMLTYDFWQRNYGGDKEIVGQAINLNGANVTVVGILPQGFQYALAGPADIWLSRIPSQAQIERRFMHGTNVIGKLKEGVSLEKAEAEMAAIGSRIESEHSQSHTGTSVMLVPLQEEIVGSVRPVLLALLVAVGCVLLIACANVANLLLARSTGRRKEIAIRVALGAGRRRILQQMMTESILLALVGGAAGILLARWGVDLLIAVIPQNQLDSMPYLKNLGIDVTILAFTLGLSILTGLIFGLAPAMQSMKADMQSALKEGGKSSFGAGSSRLRSVLIVAEVALAIVLLVGAGLMMKSLFRLLQVDTGFDPNNVLAFNILMPQQKYREAAQQEAFHRQIMEKLASIPSVEGVGTIDVLPIQGGNTTKFIIEGETPPPPGEEIESNIRTISNSYFSTMKVPLIQGRFFDSRDRADSPMVLIVNKTLADRAFPNGNAIGRRLLFPQITETPFEIVGIVTDEKVNGMDVATKPVMYSPYSQDISTFTGIVIRSALQSETLLGTVRNEIRSLDPEVTVFGTTTIQQMITDSPATFLRRYPAFLIGIFAVVALILAAIGIYGVISYSVSQQRQEIGIRLALGAEKRHIVAMVMKQGVYLVAGGVGVGLAASFGVTRLLASLLFGVSPNDPFIMSGIAVLIALVALLACFIPARRATKVDPMIALRYE
jgi:putative ABC transport system permease protein